MEDSREFKASEATAEELAAVLKEVTDEDILEEILGVDEGGRTRSLAMACLCAVAAPAEGAEPQVEMLGTMELGFCSVEVSSYDGLHCAVSLIFDSPEDAYLKDLEVALADYAQRLSAAGEEMDSYGEDEAPEGMRVPDFALVFTPKKYGGFVFAEMSSPIDWSRSIAGDGLARCERIVYDLDDVTYAVSEPSAEEITEMRAQEMRDEQAAEEAVYRG